MQHKICLEVTRQTFVCVWHWLCLIHDNKAVAQFIVRGWFNERLM